MDEPRPMPDPLEIISAVEWAGTFLSEMMHDWPEWAFEYSDAVDLASMNRFPDEVQSKGDSVYTVDLDQKHGRAVANMCWALQPRRGHDRRVGRE